MKRGFFCLFVIATFILPIYANAIEDELPTARQHYAEVEAEVRKLAADAKLVSLHNGSDLVLPGNAHNWQYFFVSESKNEVYHFVYEEDDREIQRVIPVSPEPGREIYVGMNALPTNWIDSDKAIEYSDKYGGTEYRNSHSTGYHIELHYLPAVIDGTNSFYTNAVCEVHYAGDDEFAIPIDVVTGEHYDVFVITARQLVADVLQVTQRNYSDAELISLNGGDIGLNGKTRRWFYIYKSPGSQKLFSLFVHGGKIGMEPEYNPNDDTNLNTPPLPETWMDSDSAILIAEGKGGSLFRANNQDWRINMQLQTSECANVMWKVNYEASSGSDQFEVSALGSGIPHTANIYLNDVLSKATQIFNDAQLIYVFGEGVDEYGVVSAWNYIFKSQSQQDVIHLVGYPGGSICLQDEIGGYISKEDYLQFEAIPDIWRDSDTIVKITEEYGGLEFRQNNIEWTIAMYLEKDKNSGKTYWHVKYGSPSDEKSFWVKATNTKKSTARQYLNLADSLAATIVQGAHLVFVRAGQVDSIGSSDAWVYVYETADQNTFIEIWITDGIVSVPDTPSIDWLEHGQKPIPDLWMDSDSVIGITESMGGKTFRESTTQCNVEMNLHTSSEDEYHWNIYYIAEGEGDRHYHISSNGNYDDSWPKTFGGADFDIGYCIGQAQDEGYIIAGTTSSDGAGKKDAFILKLHENGLHEWSHPFGGPEDETARSILKTTGYKGYIIAANTESYGSGVNDAWLIKKLNSGSERWSQVIGNSGTNYQYDVVQTADTGYVFTGKTQSDNTSDFNFWLHKTDKGGNEQWSKTFGGANDDIAYSLVKTPDEGFILAGSTTSSGSGNNDAYLVKTDHNGNELWSKTFGGAGDDLAYSIQNTSDNGFIFAGYTSSSGEGEKDVWLVKTDANGNQLWAKTFGGAYDDLGKCVKQTSDGGFIITGSNSSEGAGGKDLWFVRTNNTGDVKWSKTFGGEMDDFGESVIQTINGEFLAVGGTYSYGEGDCDIWLVKANDSGSPTHLSGIKKPGSFVLSQNYPNPFSTKTTISFQLNKNTNASFYFYNIQGKLVKATSNKYYNPGKYQINFNAEELASGIYFYKFQTNESSSVKKMIIRK